MDVHCHQVDDLAHGAASLARAAERKIEGIAIAQYFRFAIEVFAHLESLRAFLKTVLVIPVLMLQARM